MRFKLLRENVKHHLLFGAQSFTYSYTSDVNIITSLVKIISRIISSNFMLMTITPAAWVNIILCLHPIGPYLGRWAGAANGEIRDQERFAEGEGRAPLTRSIPRARRHDNRRGHQWEAWTARCRAAIGGRPEGGARRDVIHKVEATANLLSSPVRIIRVGFVYLKIIRLVIFSRRRHCAFN